jgi:uncharacterized membrane protein required for colicin V production
MNSVDIVILVITLFFAAHGWSNGLVRSAGSLAAFVLSIIGSFYVMGWASDTFGISFAAYPWLTVAAFLVVLGLATKLASYLVNVLDLVRKIIAIIPFVNLMNSILGAVFGALRAVSLVLVFAYLVVTLAPAGAFREASVGSDFVSRAIDAETSLGIL